MLLYLSIALSVFTWSFIGVVIRCLIQWKFKDRPRFREINRPEWLSVIALGPLYLFVYTGEVLDYLIARRTEAKAKSEQARRRARTIPQIVQENFVRYCTEVSPSSSVINDVNAAILAHMTKTKFPVNCSFARVAGIQPFEQPAGYVFMYPKEDKDQKPYIVEMLTRKIVDVPMTDVVPKVLVPKLFEAMERNIVNEIVEHVRLLPETDVEGRGEVLINEIARVTESKSRTHGAPRANIVVVATDMAREYFGIDAPNEKDRHGIDYDSSPSLRRVGKISKQDLEIYTSDFLTPGEIMVLTAKQNTEVGTGIVYAPYVLAETKQMVRDANSNIVHLLFLSREAVVAHWDLGNYCTRFHLT